MMTRKSILRVLALSMALLLMMTSSGLALTLRYPQRGSNVSSLQTALSRLGYYDDSVDGIYGKGTRSAVRAFQKAYGLSVDGVAGPATLAKIADLTGIQIGDTPAGGESSGSGNTGSSDKEEEDSPAVGGGLFGGVYTTIQFGAKGERVRILQRALMALGFDVGKVDGSFGSGTHVAVQEFQRSQGLTADGKAGKKTLSKLETYFDSQGNCLSGPLVTDPPKGEDPKEEEPEEEIPEADIPTRTLRYGMSGLDVKYTQQRLAALGYYTGAVDGKFGSEMQKAAKAFQRKNHLAADGVIGPATIKVLFSNDAIAAEEEAVGTATPTPTPTPTPAPTLSYGSRGDAVREMQKRLLELGYYTGNVDGVFGSGTLRAVQLFQSRNSLAVNGEANAATLERLYSDNAVGAEEEEEATASPTPTPTPTPTPVPEQTKIPDRTLRYGDSGDDVILLQNRLKELGYFKATVDGSFGSSTRQAVRDFQQTNGLSVDGVAGSKTYAKLFSDGALRPTPAPGAGNTLLIPDRTLTSGDSGEDVKSVQQRLKNLGYRVTAIDGEYGAGTVAAMKAFQQMNALTATGSGNMATYARLYSDDALMATGVKAGESAPAYTNLRVGATGPAVIRLQQALKALDYDVQVTGTYDTATSQAVRSFQVINGLSVDGTAGKNTQTKLYSGSAKGYPTGPENAIYGSMGYVSAPAKSQIKLLHWKDYIKDRVAYGDALLCYDPATGISWSLTIIARGRHCDVEPSTAADTAAMNAAFGGKADWTPKPVYVRLPFGTWTVATTHNVAHGINPIPDNNFEGQNCVHFLRDMSEAEDKDPDYGVDNQKALRKFWKELTGQDIAYK